MFYAFLSVSFVFLGDFFYWIGFYGYINNRNCRSQIYDACAKTPKNTTVNKSTVYNQ